MNMKAVLRLICAAVVAAASCQAATAHICHIAEYGLATEFLNHYHTLLNSRRTESVADTLRRTKDSGLQYLSGGDADMQRLTGEEDMTFTFADGRYVATWSRGGRTLVACAFPANIELLTFCGKKALEERMLAKLRAGAAPASVDLKRSTDGLSKVEYSDLWVHDRGYYVTPRLKHQVAYVAAGPDSCTLLHDTDRYPLETLANEMLTGHGPHDHMVNLHLSLYGYKEAELSLPFSTLFGVLAAEGCVPYWGVDQYDGRRVNGVYVWINALGGYAHMLAVTRDAEMKMKMHCYIRLDNIKSLFEEYPEL